MPFVVAGATGHTGKIVAETLIAQKRPVRVLVRDAAKGAAWKQKGADFAVVADLGDTAALTAALKDAEGAYFLIPPALTAPDILASMARVTESIARAVEATKVPHAVFLSSLGAELTGGTGPIMGLHRAEERLRRIPGTAWTFIRAGYFMENLGSSLGTLPQGKLSGFIPAGQPIWATATDDIGRLAAQSLLEPTRATEVVELAGPPFTMNDAAAALTRITGKPVEVAVGPLAAVVPVLTGFGMSNNVAEGYREMNEAFGQNKIGPTGTLRRVPTTTPLETVLRRLLGS